MSCNQTECTFFEAGTYYGDPAGCCPDGCHGCAEVCPLTVGWNEENTRPIETTRVIDLDKETKPLSAITYPMERYVTTETCKECGSVVIDGYCGPCNGIPF